MANENDNALSLGLVHSVLERQLGYLNRGDNVSVTLNLNVVDAVDQVSNLIRLGEA